MNPLITIPIIPLLLLVTPTVPALEKQTDAPGSHGPANAHMNRMDFDKLVARFEAPGRKIWQKPDRVIESLGDLHGKTVVEIGSGTGYFSFRLAQAGARVIAADVDPRFQNYIKRVKAERQLDDATIRTRLLPYDSPRLAKAEADIVLLVDVYHHIEHRENYFEQVRAGLKPQGRLVIIDFKSIATPDGPPLSMRMPPGQVQAELKKAGFSRFRLDSDTLPYQYVLTAE